MTPESHGSLAQALAAFQSEAPTLHKGQEAKAGSYTYKYVDRSDIVEAIKPIMAKHGLSFSAFPCVAADGRPALRYALRHSGGDVESDVMPLMVAKPDAQALGSAITYGRRYALCAVLNLVADADDDGAAAKAAQERHRAQGNGSTPQPTAQPSQATERPASAKQRGMLNARASSADLPPTDFANAVLVATGQDVRDFESQAHAEQWLKRALDRLPARHVDEVLRQIDQMAKAPA